MKISQSSSETVPRSTLYMRQDVLTFRLVNEKAPTLFGWGLSCVYRLFLASAGEAYTRPRVGAGLALSRSFNQGARCLVHRTVARDWLSMVSRTLWSVVLSHFSPPSSHAMIVFVILM